MSGEQVMDGQPGRTGMQTAQLHELMPFAGKLGIELVEASNARVEAKLPWSSSLCTAGGVMHGGVLMALADSCGGLCAVLNLPDLATGTATISSSTNLLSVVHGGTVTACAVPLHVGRMTIVIETSVVNDDGKQVANTVQTQAVLR
jgi:1,4-dihydroxy-2-naphthoyl-CoA hydrolase